MGQKVHPEGFRLGVQRKGEKVDFKSSWYSDRDFAELLGEDLKIREHIEKKLTRAGIADVKIRKAAEQGDATAQRLLGFLYEEGQGVAQDYSQVADSTLTRTPIPRTSGQ